LGEPVAEEDQAVGLTSLQHQRVLLLAIIVVLCIAKQHGVAGVKRRALDALQDQCKAPAARMV
jgi:hypothetical protein